MSSDSRLSSLRTTVRGLCDVSAPSAPMRGREPVSLGRTVADRILGGGLRRDGLHECHAAKVEHGPSTLGFALLLAHVRWQKDSRPILWIQEARGIVTWTRPYGPGVEDLGIASSNLVLLRLPDGRAVLRAGLDAVRDGSVSAVLIELHGRQPLLDLTATRRLTLAAAETDTMVLLVRDTPVGAASAAHTRWQVEACTSTALEADAPGAPAFALTLMRQRGGGREGQRFRLTWDREAACFIDQDGHDVAQEQAPTSVVYFPVRAVG